MQAHGSCLPHLCTSHFSLEGAKRGWQQTKLAVLHQTSASGLTHQYSLVTNASRHLRNVWGVEAQLADVTGRSHARRHTANEQRVPRPWSQPLQAAGCRLQNGSGFQGATRCKPKVAKYPRKRTQVKGDVWTAMGSIVFGGEVGKGSRRVLTLGTPDPWFKVGRLPGNTCIAFWIILGPKKAWLLHSLPKGTPPNHVCGRKSPRKRCKCLT